MAKKKSTKESLVSLSTTLPVEVKDLLDRYCQRKGIKINHFLETAILEKLEDEMDADLIDRREIEELIEWKRHA